MSKLSRKAIAPRLFGEVVDRAQTEMPETYMPSAEGVLIAGVDRLRAIANRHGPSQTTGWSEAVSGFKKLAGDGTTVLWVQPCGRFWLVERSLRLDDGRIQDETLVAANGPLLIWAPTRAAAMRLAEHCDPVPGATVRGRWAKIVQ